MAPGFTLRVSCICLLLSCAAAFPATKGDYKYPYTATWSSSGSSGSSISPSGGSRLPLMPLSQPQAPAQQPSSTSSFSAPSMPAPVAPPEGTGYVSPPTSPEKKAPSFPVQPQLGSGTVGDRGATSRFAPSHGNAPVLSMGDGPMPYRGGSGAGYPVLSMGDGPMPYRGGSSAGYPAPRNEDGRVPYGGDAPVQPAGEAYISAPALVPLPPHPFPEFRWEEVPETPSETSPMLPSSYIIQTRNGFQRARDFHSHMQYSPEYLPPPVYSPAENNPPPVYSPPENNPPRKAPASGPKGAVFYRG